VVKGHGYQGAFAPREAGILASSPALCGLKPGGGITPQYRSGTDGGQLSKAALAGEFLAECLVADDRRTTLVPPSSVSVDKPCPDVATGTQQSIAAVSLATGDTQPDGCGAVYPSLGGESGGHSELMFDLLRRQVKLAVNSGDKSGEAVRFLADPLY